MSVRDGWKSRQGVCVLPVEKGFFQKYIVMGCTQKEKVKDRDTKGTQEGDDMAWATASDTGGGGGRGG